MTYYHEEAIKAVNTLATRAHDLGDTLSRYAKDMEDTRDVPASERMSWAINEVENFLRNVNFSILARTLARADN